MIINIRNVIIVNPKVNRLVEMPVSVFGEFNSNVHCLSQQLSSFLQRDQHNSHFFSISQLLFIKNLQPLVFGCLEKFIYCPLEVKLYLFFEVNST